jgi:ABC-2 type transport system permease protein
MKRFYYIFEHEIRVLLISPSTYIAACLFLFLQAILYLTLLEDYSRIAQDSLPSIDFFKIFWLPVFCMVPLLTMRSLAEERRLGTLETLLTTPITTFQIVTGKFLSSYFFYLFLWAITLLFPHLTVLALPSSSIDNRLIDPASWYGGFMFVSISGSFFIAIGIFCSSLTRSQLIAGMMTFIFLFIVIVGLQLIVDLPWIKDISKNWTQDWIGYFQIFEHLSDFSKGVFDTRPFFLYLSNTLLLLAITTLIVESKL